MGLLVQALALLAAVHAAAPPPLPDAGYEETIAQRWSADDLTPGGPFPPVPGLGVVGSVATVGSAVGPSVALALDTDGTVTVFGRPDPDANPDPTRPLRPAPIPQHQIRPGPGSCLTSVDSSSGLPGDRPSSTNSTNEPAAVAFTAVLISPERGVQLLACVGGAPCTVAATLALKSPLLAAGVSACAAAADTPSRLGVGVTVYIVTNAGDVWMAGSRGGAGGLAHVPGLQDAINGSAATAWNTSLGAVTIAAAPGGGGALAVATVDRLYTRARGNAAFTWEWATLDTAAEGCSGGAITAPPTALLFVGESTLYIGHTFGVQRMDLHSGALSRVAGLPWSNVTSLGALASAPDTLFVGTTRGLVRISHGVVRYFYLSRYLPGVAVRAVAAIPPPGGGTGEPCEGVPGGLLPPAVAVATDAGMAILTPQCWTLSRKAGYFQSIAEARHNRHGLAASAVLPGPNNYSSFRVVDNDNDGLWTGIYAASQVFRRAAGSKAEAATAAAEIANRTAAIAFLQDVTGPPTGRRSMARSVATVGEHHDADRVWYNSSTSPGWIWKGDCSSDETLGHVFAWATLGLVEPAAGDRGTAAHYLQRLVGGIVDHKLTLVDATGLATRWGHWDPAWVNGGRAHSDNRGVNSVQIISHLRAAAALVEENRSTFDAAVAGLKERHGYGLNAINARILYPADENFSDDMLTWLPYYVHLVLANASAVDPEVLCSMARAWSNGIRERRSAFYALIHAVVLARTADRPEWSQCGDGAGGGTARDDDREVVATSLRSWPLDWLNWEVHNSHREDLRLTRHPGRLGIPMSTTVVPTNEIEFADWSCNPYALDGDGYQGPPYHGNKERYPGSWLLAFWMARHHGIIAP